MEPFRAERRRKRAVEVWSLQEFAWSAQPEKPAQHRVEAEMAKESQVIRMAPAACGIALIVMLLIPHWKRSLQKMMVQPSAGGLLRLGTIVWILMRSRGGFSKRALRRSREHE
jgi:hypothetical protein